MSFDSHGAVCRDCTYTYSRGVCCCPPLGVPSGLLGLYEEPAPLARPPPFSAPSPLRLGPVLRRGCGGTWVSSCYPLPLPAPGPPPCILYMPNGCREVAMPFTLVLACHVRVSHIYSHPLSPCFPYSTLHKYVASLALSGRLVSISMNA